MEYNISISTENGTYAKVMKKMPLGEFLKRQMQNPPEDKHECWLFSNGYSDAESYHRLESEFRYFDTILLDVDNKDSDPTLLKQFEEEYKEYAYFLWESASSTPECPKFRVIMLMDNRMEWSHDAKIAIKQLFGKYTDDNASWYFSICASKVNTFRPHMGAKRYPSYRIAQLASTNRRIAEEASSMAMLRMSRYQSSDSQYANPDGWRNLPSVKKCLDGLVKGERDTSLNAACYAMDKCGYRAKIREFLSEVCVDAKIKQKFLGKY